MTPEQQLIVAQQTLEGIPGCKIAQSMGVHDSTISRVKAKLKPYMEGEFAQLMMRGLTPSRRTMCRLAAIGNKSDDKDLLKLSLDASKAIIAHANAQPGTIINAMIQINQAPEQEQAVNLLGEFLKSKMVGVASSHTPPAIDIQPEPPSGQVEGSQDEPVDNSQVNQLTTPPMSR